MRVQSSHESDEQSVAGQTVYKTSNFREEPGHQMPKGAKWLKAARSVEWSGGCQTGIKALSNQDGMDGS